MSLKDRLASDYKEAVKAHDAVRKNTVNLVRAAVKQYEVDSRTELDEQGVIDVISKQLKMRKDSLSDFEKAKRTDLIEDCKKEIEILEAYLPEQLSADEIRAIVESVKSELNIEGGKENMGRLMGAVMPKVKGLADGNLVREIVTGAL